MAWEGVSMYLSPLAVADTLDPRRGLRPRFDAGDGFLASAPRRGPHAALHHLGTRAIALIGEPVTFGLAPTQVAGLLDVHGFEVIDLVQSRELAALYSTGGRPCEESVYVLTARL